MTQRLKTLVANGKKRQAQEKSQIMPFAGVSEMNMAPVTIGNTLRSSKPQAVQTANGVTVTGRDFVMSVGGVQASYTGWCLTAGFPLTPAALNASSLRGYFQVYERFRFRRAVVHFITSSATSASGDILILHHNNRGGPKVNPTSSNFMSYALSTDSAVLGPQWVNHSIDVLQGIPQQLCYTDIFNTEDIQHQANGEVLVYTKNTFNGAADSPGYILIDYVVEFQSRMLNPRVNILPSALLKYHNGNFNASGTPALGDPVSFAVTGVNTYLGTAGVVPAGISIGDVFQIVMDLSSPTITGGGDVATNFATMSALFGTVAYTAPGRQVFPLTPGGTYYCVWDGTVMQLYANYPAALSGLPVVWNFAGAAGISCPAQYSLVGSRDNTYSQSNIG